MSSKSSKRRRDANRRNAKLSTGPKTEEGKQASRANAVTHGYTSTVVPHPADIKAVASGREALAAAYPATARDPETETARAVIALNRAQLKRICENDLPDLEAREREAREETIQNRRKSFHELLKREKKEAHLGVAAELETSPEGLDWKIQSWNILGYDLEAGHPLTFAMLRRIHALLGIDPDPDRETPDSRQILTFYVDAGGETPDGNVADLSTTTARTARRLLVEMVHGEISRLEALKPAVNRAVEEEIKTAVRRSRIDTSPRGKTLQRHVTAITTTLVRMTKELERHEAAALAAGSRRQSAASPEKAPKSAETQALIPTASPCATKDLTAVTKRSQAPPPPTVEPPPNAPETPLSGSAAPEIIRTEANAS